jgi:hypothetical protein
MPPKQMNTRMIKEALRYKFELGHSLERTAMALKISKGVVAKYVGLSKAAGLDWSQIEAMTEAASASPTTTWTTGRWRQWPLRSTRLRGHPP